MVHILAVMNSSVHILLAAMSCMMLYRWRNKLYSFLTLATVISAAVNVALIVPLYRGGISGSWILGAVFLSFIVGQAGFFLLFKHKDYQLLFPYIVMFVLWLVAIAIALFYGEWGAVLLAVTSITSAIFLYFWGLPQLPKERLFLISFALHIVASLAAGVFAFWPHEFLLPVIFAFVLLCSFSMFIIFFDRTIDVMQAVSVSSITDGLTGLYNKPYFKRLVEGSILRSGPAAVIFSDIDNFKRLNDTQGHQTGDAILKVVADILKDVVGSHGVCGRYGGEEMVALLTDPHCDPSLIAEKFRFRVEEETKLIYPVTVSVGYSRLHGDNVSADEFIKQADEAMYFSKQHGKNRVTNFAVIAVEDEDVESKPDSFVFD